MWVTRKADAAIRALMGLSDKNTRKAIPLPVLAKQANISIPFLQQVLFDLRRAGLVRGERGRVGGYVLARSGRNISVGDVLRAIQGNVAPSQCSVGKARPLCGRGYCSIRPVWMAVRKATERVVDNVSVEELHRRERRRG